MIKTRSSNKKSIELAEEEYIKKKNQLTRKMKQSLTKIEFYHTKKQKIKEVLKIIKITELYSNIIFNTEKTDLVKFAQSVRDKYFFFIETEPAEKELVLACKKFLYKHYDYINFNCEAYTLNGSRCKNYKKEKLFCHIHDGKFVPKITQLLTPKLNPVIANLCVSKIF
jgi:hypothetical protein